MNEYILHVHSGYSLHDSPQSLKDIALRAQQLGCRALTLTDHRTLAGAPDALEASKKYGINIIPGVENEVSIPGDIIEAIAQGNEESRVALAKVRNHILLVPFDYEGFQAIGYATRDANTNLHFVKKKAYPCMTNDMVAEYFTSNPHVFATSACIQGPIGYILLYNFRIDERIQTRAAIDPDLEDDYNAYIRLVREEEDMKSAIKATKSRITAELKPLKEPFIVRMDKMRAKLRTLPEGQAMHKKTQAALEAAETAFEAAKQLEPLLNAELEDLLAKKLTIENKKSEAKKGYNKYLRLLGQQENLLNRKVDDSILYDAAKKRLLQLKNIFPHFFVEMQFHGLEAERYVMPILLRLADETGTPIIAGNDAHIPDNSESSIEARRLVRFNMFEKSEVVSPSDREMYMKSDEELIAALSEVIPYERAVEAVKNVGILERCNVEIPDANHYPKVTGGKSSDQMLAEARQKKIDAGTWTEEYQARLEYEEKVVKSMGYVDYHCVVEHFCRVGRLMGLVPENRRNEIYDHFADLAEWVEAEGFDIGIGIGPGRGSAVGSLVCYLLGITNVDPIKYNLLFERFLNPERISMPDIDTDIATSIRPILIAYLQWHYGQRAVCSIATTTTYAAKNAVRHAGRDRACQLFGEKDNPGKRKYAKENTYVLTDLIPNAPGTTLSSCEAEILPQIAGDAEKELIWKRAKLIEGKISGTGVHAGGIIISDNHNINDHVPLAWNPEKSVWVAQCNMTQAEEMFHLLKMDVLGLSNLDVMNVCVNLVKQHHGVSIDLDSVPFESEVFAKIYATGNTNSVFQVESPGMKKMLRNFKPTCFEDIILMVAAYRPGPMQYLDGVIAVKNGKQELFYKHPLLESILSTTYGACIYQGATRS